MSTPLHIHFERINLLFGQRNAMFLDDKSHIIFILSALLTFSKRARRTNVSEDREAAADELASYLARVIGFANKFIDLPIIEALSVKYGGTKCRWCGAFPCECGKRRREEIASPQKSDNESIKYGWGINDWICQLKAMYGPVNQKRGIDYAVSQLGEEISEAFQILIYDVHAMNIPLSQTRWRMARELADTYAWIFSFAAKLDLDLESAFEKQYGGVHRRCGKCPCDCGPYHLAPKDGPSLSVIPTSTP